MIDVTKLLVGLEDYQSTATRHVLLVREDFEAVQRTWHRLDECYRGEAADEFQAAWLRAASMMSDYTDGTDAILAMLRARIEYLRAVDKPTGLDGI